MRQPQHRGLSALFLSLLLVATAAASNLRLQGDHLRRGLQEEEEEVDCNAPIHLTGDIKAIPECKQAAHQFELWFFTMTIPSQTAIRSWAQKICSPTCEGPYAQALQTLNHQAAQCHGAEQRKSNGTGTRLFLDYNFLAAVTVKKPMSMQDAVNEDTDPGKKGEAQQAVDNAEAGAEAAMAGAGGEARQGSILAVYPGFVLGCVKDSSDGEYCSTKANGGETKSCDYLQSCCFGELNHRKHEELSPDDAIQVESLCPGAANAASMTCSATNTTTRLLL